MRPIILIFFLFFAQFFGASYAQTLDITRDQNTDNFWLLGSANGSQERAFFLVDTGAGRTIFSPETANKYGIENKNCNDIVKAVTPAGFVTLCQKTVKKLEVGFEGNWFVFYNVEIYILSNLQAAPALLGNDLLKKFLIIQHGLNGQILTLSR